MLSAYKYIVFCNVRFFFYCNSSLSTLFVVCLINSSIHCAYLLCLAQSHVYIIKVSPFSNSIHISLLFNMIVTTRFKHSNTMQLCLILQSKRKISYFFWSSIFSVTVFLFFSICAAICTASFWSEFDNVSSILQ